MAIWGKVVQIVGNNMQDMGNKMKTKRAGGMDAVGPEFRPVAGGAPQQTNKEQGPMSMISGIMGNKGGGMKGMFGGGQGAGEAAQAAGQGAGSMAGSIGSWFSDERVKEPTSDTADMIAEVAEAINNYSYHYKPGMGEDPSVEYSGPMAQELLQVDGYRSAVFEDPETGLLKVDTGRLAMVNAGMIADISKRLIMIEELIKSIMGGFQGEQPMPDVE